MILTTTGVQLRLFRCTDVMVVMTEQQSKWIKASEEALKSYRQMYALAVEVEANVASSGELVRAARRVTHVLAPIIDLPIADAKTLGKARKKFNKLAALIKVKMSILERAA